MRLLHPWDGTGGDLDEAGLVELYRHPLPSGRPAWVRSNFVTSLDGSIQGADGRSGGLGTPSDQHVFALQRAWSDAVLVAAGTARAEGYRAVDLAPWQQTLRAQAGLAPFPLLVVVSGSLDVDPGIGRNGPRPVGPVLLVTTAGHPPDRVAPFRRSGVEVVELGRSSVELPALLDLLAARGCPRVLCEGGPRLHRDLLAADLLDELSLTLAPVAVGGDGPRTTAGEPVPGARGFALRSALLADDQTLLLSYQRRRD